MAALTISATLPEIRQALESGSAVLAAPPGSGKTTGVPLALLDEAWLDGRKILMLEPRRLAARAAASRMSRLLDEPIGRTVGYQIRFDRCISPATRIEVLTEGILTRRLQNDPDLTGVGLVIFDEFHERSIHADLALALCLDICQLRDDLRLLVMSATLDAEPVAEILGHVPLITGHGRSFPVTTDYLDHEPAGRIAVVTVQGIRRVLAERTRDILAFLPGAGEIREAAELLAEQKNADTLILPLYGNLSQQEQDLAILPDPAGRRRVILATSIAETSLTIEGIDTVVDSGWSRLPRFQPASGMSRLETVRVSRAAARQRAGRAGRLGPGHCLRLWTRHQHHGLAPFHPPEIRAADLAPLALELALWGVSDPGELRWLDPPPEASYAAARGLLLSLAALDHRGRITAEGKRLAALPLHPRLAHMLIKAGELGQGALACDVAALVSERDVIGQGSLTVSADLHLRLALLARFRLRGPAGVREQGGDVQACRRAEQLAGQWGQMLHYGAKGYDEEMAGLVLSFAYPDRIAAQRPGQRERYQLAAGRGAFLPPGDPLAASRYLVAAQLDAGHKEGRIYLAAPVDPAELRSCQPELFHRQELVSWDDEQQRVTTLRREYLGSLVMNEQNFQEAGKEEILQAMADGIRRMGLASLPWSGEARRLQARINCLREWQPEGNWPDLADEQLLADLGWLTPYLTGLSRRDQLRQLSLTAIFSAMLDWRQQQELDRAAPDRLEVPSGSRIRLDYRPGETPVLAVRLQEMFGLQETPTICHGRVKLLLHLLSPAQRPIQVTADLAGFWQRAYPEVKKELKGRYPKHHWPDDPLSAQPTSKTKKRSSV
ncbi:MAG: ATP-dependent helicase HrpB [Proteobacteria bacterium]|nr:ATP-dependent helicase HrpB [Pseudomonadota bacterium]